MMKLLKNLKEPWDYFSGAGRNELPSPTDVILFLRSTKDTLQQEALQNRSHHRFVLLFNLGTKGHVHLNNRVLPFEPGQAILILPYQFHHYTQLESPRLTWLFCTFGLESKPFLEPLRNQVIDMGYKANRALKEVLTEWNQPPSGLQARQLQTTLLRLLLSLHQERRAAGDDLPPEPHNSLVRSVNRLMAEWGGRTMVVADLAAALGYSESRLRVLFKEAAGIPLGGYIQNYRINRAMALLRTSGLSIAEIAEEAGFGSPQAFSRIFKKTTGQTPRAYRTRR